MSIRVKFLIACLCCALIPLIGYAGYTYARTVQHLDRLENGQLAARETAVSQALDDMVSRELADVDDTVTWPAFVSAVEREDVRWLRRQLAALPVVAAGGTAQLFTPDGRLLLAAGPSGAGSLWTSPEVQHVVGLEAPAAGYETLAGRLSIAAAERVEGGSGPRQPLAVLAVARPVDRVLLDTIGCLRGGAGLTGLAGYGRARSSPAATPPPGGNGVLNQFGETFTQGRHRSAYLGVYDVDGYRSGLVAGLHGAERRQRGGRGDPHRRGGGPGGGARGGDHRRAARVAAHQQATPGAGRGRGRHRRRETRQEIHVQRQRRGRAARRGVQHDVRAGHRAGDGPLGQASAASPRSSPTSMWSSARRSPTRWTSRRSCRA